MNRHTIDMWVDYVEDIYVGLSSDKKEILKLLESFVGQRVRITIERIDEE